LTFEEKKCLEELKISLIKNYFVILDGPLQSGKSTIVEQLEQQSIRIYIDNQTDLKSLIGCYICTEKIGLFEWADGPLTQALK
jgi:midasin